MHERNQRLICRLGFFLVCFVPTTVTAACIAVRATPWYAAAVLDEIDARLEQSLGVAVLLGEVKQVGPQAWLLEGVDISDPETNAHIARITTIDARFFTDEEGVASLDITLSQPQVKGEQLSRLWSTFERRLLRGEATLPARVRVFAGEVTIEGEASGQTFSELLCQIDREKTGRVAKCQFQLPNAPEGEHVTLVARRRREENSAFSEFTFETGGAAIPCAEFAAWAPWLAPLGSESRFKGSVELADSADGWGGELKGEFTSIDLNELVTERFPHKLAGRGSVNIEWAKFQGGRLSEAKGVFEAHEGAISASLFAACETSLQLKPADDLGDKSFWESLMPYRLMKLRFDITTDGLRIDGLCPGATGVVCRDDTGPLLFDGGGRISSVVSLACALSRENEILVPASPETDDLLKWLPTAPMIAPRERIASPQLRIQR